MKVKFYVLEGSINGLPIRSRSFVTRDRAERFLNAILQKKNLQVEEDRFPQPQTEEFVCNYYTRFFIREVEA